MVSDRQLETFLNLVAAVPGPYYLLWVLITPRGGSEAGRYQSGPFAFDELRTFLGKYREFFEQDGRSDLWVGTREPASTIVLDRHDRIYAYGPIAKFAAYLKSAGFSERQTSIPSPHAHEYHAEFDEAERSMASALDWAITELRPEDET